MNTAFGIILSLIFITISSFHFYWAFGGRIGLDRVLPTDKNGVKVINPGVLSTLIVAFGLLLFAFYYLIKIDLIQIEIPHLITKYCGWIVLSIFILRSIGDFKYVGFFKKIKDTGFGMYDTKYYSPLCLIIGLIGIYLEI